jgi:hypothetical protein
MTTDPNEMIQERKRAATNGIFAAWRQSGCSKELGYRIGLASTQE